MSLSIDGMLVGESVAMRRVRAEIAAVAPSRVPVLIQGETGTGKELVAAALHGRSARRGALVAFNVAAIGDTMFEDALFGHARGAFTGAHREVSGYLREATGGTVFLDEIGSLPLGLQPKLLRAIETGVFRPVGATRDVTSDFRVVSATNESVTALVADGRFRADLAHRLGGFVIRLPSLDERREDIPLLVRHFLSHGACSETTPEEEALHLLQDRRWPGNVRELKQVVDVAAVFSAGGLTVDAVRLALGNRECAETDARAVQVDPAREDLRAALDAASWDVDVVARTLGIHRATLYRRMRRLGLGRREESPRAARFAWKVPDDWRELGAATSRGLAMTS